MWFFFRDCVECHQMFLDVGIARYWLKATINGIIDWPNGCNTFTSWPAIFQPTITKLKVCAIEFQIHSWMLLKMRSLLDLGGLVRLWPEHQVLGDAVTCIHIMTSDSLIPYQMSWKLLKKSADIEATVPMADTHEVTTHLSFFHTFTLNICFFPFETLYFCSFFQWKKKKPFIFVKRMWFFDFIRMKLNVRVCVCVSI